MNDKWTFWWLSTVCSFVRLHGNFCNIRINLFIASNEFGLIWFCWRLKTVSTTATMYKMFFHYRMLVGRGNMRLMECLHTFSQRSRIKKRMEHFFSSLNLCFKTQFNGFFLTKNERLFSIERRKKRTVDSIVYAASHFIRSMGKKAQFMYIWLRDETLQLMAHVVSVYLEHIALAAHSTHKKTT